MRQRLLSREQRALVATVVLGVFAVLTIVGLGAGVASGAFVEDVDEAPTDDTRATEVGTLAAGSEQPNGTVQTTSDGKTVYVASGGASVYAIETSGGSPTVLWQYNTSGGLASAPTVANGTVYVSSSDGTLSALDAETGDVEWKRGTAQYFAVPTIVDGVVYVGSPTGRSGTLRALDAKTGTELWATGEIGEVGVPNVVNGTIYVSADDFFDGESVYAIDAEAGATEWQYNVTNGIGDPKWYNGTIYVSGDSLHAIDADTGEREWMYSLRRTSPPAVSNGTVYVGVDRLRAIDAETGVEKWSRKPGNDREEFGAPTVYNGTVYAGTEHGFDNDDEAKFYAVDAGTGDLEWVNNQLDGNLDRAPTVRDGTVYATGGLENGYLYGLDLDTGDKRFEFNVSGGVVNSAAFGAPTVVEDRDGDSIGTRVRQGVLGHNDAFPHTGSAVVGQVTDTDGNPVPNATVSADDEYPPVTTNATGHYELVALPGTYSVGVTALGFEEGSATVTVPDDGTVRQEFDLSEALDVAPIEGQRTYVGAGNDVEVRLDVTNADTITVTNTGTASDGLTLLVDGTEESFGDTVTLNDSDGEVTVTVETSTNTSGTVELEHTVEGLNDSKTVTTGPSKIVQTVFEFGVVDDDDKPRGVRWADAIDATLANSTGKSAIAETLGIAPETVGYEVEHVTSHDVLGGVDAYDAYFVHDLDEDNEGDWFNETDDVGTVYTVQGTLDLGVETLIQRSETIGDPAEVTTHGNQATWHITEDHVIFSGVAEPGEEVRVHTLNAVGDYGGSFSGTTADTIADAPDGDSGIAVDDSRYDVLMAGPGEERNLPIVELRHHTEEALEILANSLVYTAQQSGGGVVEGQVTDTTGDPLANVTVDVVDALPETTTDANGSYELALDPAEYTLEADALGYESESATVTVGDRETVTQDFQLAETADVRVEDGQRNELESGEVINVTLSVAKADTLTVRNLGTAGQGLELYVDGQRASFGEAVTVSDGEVEVEVETTSGIQGTVELEHSVAGVGNGQTVTTGPTLLVGTIARIGIVQDSNPDMGTSWIDPLNETLADLTAGATRYEIERVQSNNVLGNLDEYDVYFVQRLEDANVGNWFAATDNVPTVYSERPSGADTLGDRAREIGDPGRVATNTDLETWHVTEEHPIFRGVAGPGEEILVHTDGERGGAWFTNTSADVVAEANNGYGGVAIDDNRRDVLLTTLGNNDNTIRPEDHTSRAITVLANSLRYASYQSEATIEGQVTDAAGDPIAGATVDVRYEFPEVTTNATGHYEIGIEPGRAVLEAAAFGFASETTTVNVSGGETFQQDFTLAEGGVGAVPVDSQPDRIEAGETLRTVLDVVGANTVTVENSGTLTENLTLFVDGQQASFGESVTVDDGEVPVSVETTASTNGTVELEHTVANGSEGTTVTTGPTEIFEAIVGVAVVEDRSEVWGRYHAESFDSALESETADSVLYDVEYTTSSAVLDGNKTYDVYFVAALDEDSELDWFDATDGVGAVYTDSPGEWGSISLSQRADAIGDPDEVKHNETLDKWTVTRTHPIFDGIATPGDEVHLTTDASFTATDALVVATANDGNNAVAVDDDRRDVLLTGMDSRTDWGITPAIAVNTIQHLVGNAPESGIRGRVTRTNGEPIEDATVTVTDRATGVTTEGSGEYELPLTPGQYTLEVSALGFERDSRTVTVPPGGFEDVNVTLPETSDIAVRGGQQSSLDSGEPIRLTVETAGADTLTIQNVGNLTSGLSLSVDGTEESFGEPISVDGGEHQVTVETADDTAGTVALEHTVSGVGNDDTVTTGPTRVFRERVSVGVLYYYSPVTGDSWAAQVEDRLGDRFAVESVTFDEAIVGVDEYDVFFVHELGFSTDPGAWFDATVDTPVVYPGGAEGRTLSDRAKHVGDPGTVLRDDNGLTAWHVSEDHPIFTGVAQPGDTLRVHTSDDRSGTSFTGTSADPIARTADGNVGVAVDENRTELLLGTLAASWLYDHTDGAIDVLANSLEYLAHRDGQGSVEGAVTDADGTPIPGAEVDVVDVASDASTNASGSYERSLVPGEYTIEASAFGFASESATAVVSGGETTRVDFQLDEALDARVLDSQQGRLDSGASLETVVETIDADTVTITNSGTLTTGLTLYVDGEEASFNEPVSVTDGQHNITVATADGTQGTVDLWLLVSGSGDQLSLTTGSTDVFGTLYSIGLVEDHPEDRHPYKWVDELETTLGNMTASSDGLAGELVALSNGSVAYAVENVTSDEVLGDTDAYDAYFVHGLAESNDQQWFNRTDDVPTVYTAKDNGPTGVVQRSRVVGDPDNVTRAGQLETWHVRRPHPIFAGVAGPGDEITIHSTSTTLGASFTGTDGDVLADADDGDSAIAVDDTRRDVLLTGIGGVENANFSDVGPGDHTEDAIRVLANSLVYFLNSRSEIQGRVTDPAGDPIVNATVDGGGELAETTTDANGEYELTLEPGEYTFDVTRIGFENASKTVNLSSGEVRTVDFELGETVDAAVVERQERKIEGGNTITTSIQTIHADTVTVTNTGNLTRGLALWIDGQPAEFDTPVTVGDGRLNVTVETTANTSGTVALEHTFEGNGDNTTVTSGRTQVFEELATIGVVEDIYADRGKAWAETLEANIDGPYAVEHVTSGVVLNSAADTEPASEYDAYFVHGLDEDNETDWFATTDDVPTVYTARSFVPETLVQRSETIGDPGIVTTSTGLKTWEVTADHPIFDGVAGPGEEIPVYNHSFLTSGASFAATSATIVAEANDGDHAIGVDEFRQDILLTTIGHSSLVGPANHTDDAIQVLGNAVTHFVGMNESTVGGRVTDADGEPIANATVDVVGEQKRARTDADGRYELPVSSGVYTLEIEADGFEAVAETVPITVESAVQQHVELAPAYDVGDVQQTGELSIVDAVLIQQHLAELDPDPFDPTIADVQRTGEVSIVDAVLIQQYLAQLRDAGSAEIAAVNTPAAVATGEDMEITVTINNTGGLGVLQNVEHRLAADEDDLDDRATMVADVVDLAPGEESQITVTIDTAALSPGTYYYEVVTDDDSRTVTVQVGGDSTGGAASTSALGVPAVGGV